MTWIGTNSTRQPAATRVASISDSISKWSVCNGRRTAMSRFSRRNPHCESASGVPVNRESRRVIQRFTCRRSHGILAARSIRLPTIIAARVRSEHSRKTGMSSGACWPSPSRLSAQVKPWSRARSQPARNAAPLPELWASRITSAPALAAAAAVPSDEPSSTTMTAGRCRRTPATTAPMLAPSLWQGMTAAHFRVQSISNYWSTVRSDGVCLIRALGRVRRFSVNPRGQCAGRCG